MSANHFGHIDLRVRDLDISVRFFGAWLPLLGFSTTCHGRVWKVFGTDEPLPSGPYFAITEDAEHVPNRNRIAFWARDSAHVDLVAHAAVAAGALEIEGPAPCPEYDPSYYAVFFEDPSGNRFEIYHRM